MHDELERRIRLWRFQRFRSHWIEGSVRFAAAGAAYLLAALLLDRLWGLPQYVRWVIFWSGVGVMGTFAYLYYLLPLRDLRVPKLLRDVSDFYPEARSFLRSAWELKKSGAPRSTSKELADEHIRRTEALLYNLAGGTVFSPLPSKPAAKRTLYAFAAWGLAMPLLYNGQADIQRVIAPWKDARLDAMIEVEPGDRDVLWGDAVGIQANWRTSHRNGSLVLYMRAGEGAWEQVPWDREDGERSAVRIEGLTAVYQYQIGHKELRSRIYRLTPIPFPRLSDVTVRVHLPGLDPESRVVALEGEGEVAALRRSWVTLRGRPDRSLRSAHLRVSYLEAPIEMKQQDEGFWEGGFPLNDDGMVKIDLIAGDGARDPRPVAFVLRALDDKKPEVELLSPTFELEISPREKLTVTYEARDDYGLTSVSFLYQVNGGPERVIPLRVFKRVQDQVIADFQWDLSRFPMGSRVEFRIRAVDNGHPQRQTSVSDKGIIHVVDFESIHAETRQMWRGAEESLQRLADQEKEMVQRLDALLAAQKSAEGTAERADLQRRIDRVTAEEHALAKEWTETVSGMDDFARTMRKDPYANPGMTESAELLAGALKAFRDQDLRKAAEDSRAGRFEGARDGHQSLESRVRKASDILAAGREMQSMQDFWGEAHRMDQAGSEIADELGKIAKSGKAPSGEDVAKLQKALGKLQEQMVELAKTIEAMPKVDADSEVGKNRKVYKVPLNEARRTSDALQEALDRGDFKTAARLAEQLARQLSKVREAVAQAAGDSSGGGPGEVSEQMEEAKRMWDDVVEQQSRSLQMVAALEDSKLQEKATAQKGLLEELARLQGGIVADAEKRALLVTSPAIQAMKEVLAEFEAAQVRKAPGLLGNIIASLGFRSLRFPLIDGKASPDAAALTDLSVREQEVLEKLKQGADSPPLTETQMSGMMAASAVQKQTRRKTESLQQKVTELAQGVGTIPPDVKNSLESAQLEQAQAEEALVRRDSEASRGHQQKALEHLERGQKGMGEALSQQLSIQQGATQPFGQPRGVVRPVGRGGQSGFDRSFVPLPGAQDYQPPREIRKEIEKSLRERRPRAFEETINDYFKRMSQ